MSPEETDWWDRNGYRERRGPYGGWTNLEPVPDPPRARHGCVFCRLERVVAWLRGRR